MDHPHQTKGLRQAIWRIIFLSDTRLGKAFDVVLLWLIAASVMVVMAESVRSVRDNYGPLLLMLEWGFTLLFTIEYLTRIMVSRRPIRYIFSFFGLVDLLSILPSYLHFFYPTLGAQHLVVIRVLRILRMFRVLKMARHVGEAKVLVNALRASQPKITVFLFGVLSLVVITGTLLYLVEGALDPSSKFENIPIAIYWAVVTITTVGYGDVTPVTPVGKLLSAVVMIIGYAIIAVPTGIVGAELSREMNLGTGTRVCQGCGLRGHLATAKFCRECGSELEEEPS